MGASCVRDCERTAHELYTAEDQRGQASIPGHAAAGSSGGAGVKVGAAFANPMAAISGRGEPNSGSGASLVPPVYGMKVLQQGKNGGATNPDGSPRFDEVTPRGQNNSVAGEFNTPAGSPRESPRPPDERKMDGAGSNEISYEGERLDTMKHGTGRLRCNGNTYEGEFRKDMKHGQGVLTWDDGRQYRGQFEDNKFHGSAVMTWPDGRKYCGQYLEDRKHNEGTFSWQDGRRYQGQWVVGKRHGIGVYTNAKGLTRTGMWQMDRPLHWESLPAPSAPWATPQDPSSSSKDVVQGDKPLSDGMAADGRAETV